MFANRSEAISPYPHALITSDLNGKLNSIPSVSVWGHKSAVIKAQQQDSRSVPQSKEGRKAALALLAATLVTSAAAASNFTANAGFIEEYLEKSQANKGLNDKKRMATSRANFARAYTVEFGTCKFPENFTSCQDLAKQKKVPFILL